MLEIDFDNDPPTCEPKTGSANTAFGGRVEVSHCQTSTPTDLCFVSDKNSNLTAVNISGPSLPPGGVNPADDSQIDLTEGTYLVTSVVNGTTLIFNFTITDAAPDGQRLLSAPILIGPPTPPNISIANTTDGAEPATDGVMTVTQSAVSITDTVIAYNVAGTATAGTDYTALSGTVTIAAGDTQATIDIPVIDDAIVEGDETVVVTLTAVTTGSATLGTTLEATNTIGDDDGDISARIAQAFEAQTHNFVSRRLNLLARSSPSIHSNAKSCIAFDKGATGHFDVAGGEAEIAGSFAIANGGTNCMNNLMPYAWTEGKFAFYRDTALSDEAVQSTGSFFVGYAGVGVPLNEGLTIGLMGQIDWLEDELESGLGITTGTGWAIGPYAALKLADNLQLNVRALWGQSDNNIKQEVLGSEFSGRFKTDRWLVDADLTGEHRINQLILRPNLGFFYMIESWNEYQVSDGMRQATVDDGDLDIGNLSAALWLGTTFEYSDLNIEPYLESEVFWNFQNPGTMDSTGKVMEQDEFTASVRAGVGITSTQTSFEFELTLDGVGQVELESFGARFGLSHQF